MLRMVAIVVKKCNANDAGNGGEKHLNADNPGDGGERI